MSFHRLEVTTDRLQVFAVAVRDSSEKAVPARDLPGALGRMGVRHGFIETALNGLMGGATAVADGARVLVAQGEPPRAGADGRLELKVDVSNRAQYARKADGSLDFRETNLVHTVSAGQVLAVMHEAQPGQPGRNVFGEVVPARAGQAVRVQLGANVEKAAGGRELVAKVAGRLLFDGGKLSVEPAMVVPGDVDYSVGNIRFPGFVTVRGNVLDGFEVQADRGIEIRGTGGACTLRSAGDIAVNGGVNGHGKAVVEAGGAVRVKYLNEATVKARGDVVVASEVLHSRVSCLGRLLVPGGAVIGGESVARCGVEAEVLGSELGVATRVVIGRDFDLAGQIETLSARAVAIDGELPSLVKRLEAMADRRKFMALPEAERERVKGDFERFKALKAERIDVDARLKALAAAAELPAAAPEARVAKVMYQDVMVGGLQASHLNTEIVRGPLVLSEDRAACRMVLRR